MVHLIGFARLDCPQASSFQALYRPGDICVFTDQGLLLAGTLTLQGDGYCLHHEQITPAAGCTLPTLDHNGLLDLVAESGPCTSWY